MGGQRVISDKSQMTETIRWAYALARINHSLSQELCAIVPALDRIR
jgi:hypothetical protein